MNGHALLGGLVQVELKPTGICGGVQGRVGPEALQCGRQLVTTRFEYIIYLFFN